MAAVGIRFDAPLHACAITAANAGGAEPAEGWDALVILEEPVSMRVHDTEVRLTVLAPAIAGGSPAWDWLDEQGRDWFRVRHAHTHIRQDPPEFHAAQADVALSRAGAERAGVPAHQGLVAGLLDWSIPIEAAPDPIVSGGQGGGAPCEDGFGPAVDLRLTDLSAISQLSREPGGRVAMAPAAWLENVGMHDIRWYWAIAPTWINGTNLGSHPYLIMNFYRSANGRMEQIGRSDVKHAWNTVNLGCPCPGGQIMYPGCTDLYGAGNNGEARFFGPREEVTAHTGEWTSLGSHFDGSTVDDVRDHGVEPDDDHDEFDHRLVVWEDDLLTPDATYHVEAWYVVAGDTNIYNSMAHRPVVGALVSETWAFQFDGDTRPGPAIDAWVDPALPGADRRNHRVETPDGHLQLAVRVNPTDNPDLYHYEYALMNLDYDRQVAAFQVPVDPGVTLSNPGFTDADHDPDNPWTAMVRDGSILWTAPPGHALDWGTLYSFRFDADAPPFPNRAMIQPLEPGDGSHVLAETLAPAATPNDQFHVIRLDTLHTQSTVHAQSISGAVYRLESSPAPADHTPWSPAAGPVTAQQAVVTLTDTNSPADSRFYRLRLDPHTAPK